MSNSCLTKLIMGAGVLTTVAAPRHSLISPDEDAPYFSKKVAPTVSVDTFYR